MRVSVLWRHLAFHDSELLYFADCEHFLAYLIFLNFFPNFFVIFSFASHSPHLQSCLVISAVVDSCKVFHNFVTAQSYQAFISICARVCAVLTFSAGICSFTPTLLYF